MLAFGVSIKPIAATNVSGNISTSTIWDIFGSPYVITSSVFVDSGVTLTIDPGVTILFDNSQYLIIYGSLNATGVTFTSSSPSPSPGIWNAIEIGGPNANAIGSAVLTGCDIHYAQTIRLFQGSAILNNTNLINFTEHGLVLYPGANLQMTGGSIITTSNQAINNGIGINALENSTAFLNGITIQNFNTGMVLKQDANIQMTGGSITNNGTGILADNHSIATLNSVNIQCLNNGIVLNYNSDVSIGGVNISGCYWPIIYNASASLTPTGQNYISGNQYDVILMNFPQISDTMTINDIGIPYFLNQGMTVLQYGQLAIASNTILKFADNSGLHISGTLIADASVNEQIYFTSFKDDNWGGDSNKDGMATAPAPMDWQGVSFNSTSNDTNCLMRRCHVRYAGGYGIGGISVFDASPVIDQCELTSNYFGIYVQYYSSPVLSGNLIGSSVMTPIAISYEADPIMSNNVLSFMDNQYDAIGLIGGVLQMDATLKRRSVTSVENMTYLMLGEIKIDTLATLTIEKGIVIKSFSNAHRIVVNGTLSAVATVDSMITFTSAKDDNYGNPWDSNKDGTMTSPVVGDWGGIVFNPGSSGTLNYCRFQYAEVWNYGFSNCGVTEYLNGAAIGLIDAHPVITNCLFKDLRYGISCYRVSNPTLTNLDMTNIQFTPINISGSSNPTMIGITFTNVGWRAIGLLGGNVCNNGTIIQRNVAGFNNITYVLLEDMILNPGTYIEIVPGIIVKSNQWICSGTLYGADIFVDGGLRIDATASQKVVFTSIKDDNEGNPFDTNGDGNASTPTSGDWGYIKFRSTSDDAYCKLNYVSLKYGGSVGPCATESGLSFENAGCMVSNTLITDNIGYGLFINGNSNPVISGVTIQNCQKDPVAMSLTSDPSFNNISFAANFSSALKIIEGTLSTNATLAPRNVAGINNIAYIISNLTIDPNAKLTIAPGVVIKYRSDNWCGWWPRGPHIRVMGNLLAVGTPTSKIYLTSFADDSKGGDSNNDGNTSTPNPGDWGANTNCDDNNYGGIHFMNNSINSDTVNYLKYCEFSYSNYGVGIQNSHATFDNCTFQLMSEFGAKITGSSNPEFKDCQFYNIAKAPVELSMFSDPEFTNCTALNVGFMALAVLPETYSQSDTVPIRNFGGYNNIGYLMTQPCTINSGTTITIPPGVVFKSSGFDLNSPINANGFIVKGRLNIAGTQSEPVIFTHTADDTYGNPPDMNQNGAANLPPDGFSWGQGWSGKWIEFFDVSNDSSLISHTVFRYGDKGIITTSASPTIEHSKFENLYCGVEMNGVSSPGIDFCTFHNLRFSPLKLSLVSYPSTSSNNIISGTTWRMLVIRDETLTQDVTLPKRNFGGVTNIPYCFNDYTVGTGAILTIAPGVVCKFMPPEYYYEHGFIKVFKGLIAQGGSTPDSTIVFTSIFDDFYGGDSNADGVTTTPSNGSWKGLVFEDQSLDPFCKLKNCVIRYADNGIQTNNASPDILNTSFNNNNTAAHLTGASNPVFNQSDFVGNHYYAINNVNQAFWVNAENCWWGSNLGPVLSFTPASGPGSQEYVSDFVDYTPWKTTGAINPLIGDVSLNGLVQAYDASLLLRYTVQLETFSPLQQQVADVSGTAGITAFDASLILQYVVGLIQGFPAELAKGSTPFTPPANTILYVDNKEVNSGDQFDIPLRLINSSDVTSCGISIKFDPQLLKPLNVVNALNDMNMAWSIDTINGFILISSAGIKPPENDTTIVIITLQALETNVVKCSTPMTVARFMANEEDFTSMAVPGYVTINNVAADVKSENDNTAPSIYPNPSHGTMTLGYTLTEGDHKVRASVYNIAGQLQQVILDENQQGGDYRLMINSSLKPLDTGYYTLLFVIDGVPSMHRFQIIK